MTQMKTTLIWKKLIIDGKDIVRNRDLETMCQELGKEYEYCRKYLLEQGYLHRVFRGVYYVKNPDEMERKYFKDSIYQIVAKGLQVKGVKNWYFGLETGLKLNNMTHEYFTINYVITDSYRTTKVIKIIDTQFFFLKWSPKIFKFGIIEKNGLKYSDREKTVLDLIYRSYYERKIWLYNT